MLFVDMVPSIYVRMAMIGCLAAVRQLLMPACGASQV